MSATALPPELCMLVERHLSNRDIKSLRLVCRDFWMKFRLRLQRVFLSANPLNIRVFRSIAEHETFRHGVHEIIWDDARLRGDGRDDSDFEEEEETRDFEGIPIWYKALCDLRISPLQRIGYYKSERPTYETLVQQAGTTVPTLDFWNHYQQLLQQQEEVISTGADADALRYGLSRFPALQRLTITPAAHGCLFAPLYETPMIRAFPDGFVYPVPCAWPCLVDGLRHENMAPWNEGVREKWRGVCIVLRELARQEHSVTEFLIQAHGLETGLSCRVFDQPSQEYDDFKALLSRPGFRRLELSLNADLEEDTALDDWPSLTNGLLYEALSEATDLESLDFWIHSNGFPISHGMWTPPLDMILPFDQWPKLRHFGLGHALVSHDDLISTLERLPRSLRSVELSDLVFTATVVRGSDWLEFFYRLEDLDWHTLHSDQRPRVVVYIGQLVGSYPPRCLSKEIDRFLYENGPDPV